MRGVNSAGVAGAWSAVRSFTPQPAPPPATLSTFSTNPETVEGGNVSFGTVVLSSGAPEGGALITLSSSNPAVASVPPNATAQANDFTAGFEIATSPVSVNTTVTLTASYNNATRTATVTVTPPASQPPAPTLQSLTLNPTSVAGGSTSQGAVTLSGGAPQGGAVVSLLSGNTAAAEVPASATVAAGATSATFTVATKSVSSSATVTISGTYNTTKRAASLAVTAAGSGPLPAPSLLRPSVDARFRSGTTIAFDWTDVAGAASYTIQIDNSQSFSVPLTVEASVAGSQYSTSSLPTTRMWFRVRANDASGAPGAWSAVRRFEVRQ